MNRGFTLLEIIISLAILAGALATLGEVMRMADQNATTTEDETQAQILAASIMDELACGSRELTAVGETELNATDTVPWTYAIALDQTAYDELVAVRVRVAQKIDPQLHPASYELVRWMPNPDFTPASTSDQQNSSSNSTSKSTSTSGSNSSSSGSSSGGTKK